MRRTASIARSVVRPLPLSSSLSATVSRTPVVAIAAVHAQPLRVRYSSNWFPEQPPRLNLGLCIVPEQKAYIVERLGKWSRTLNPGLHWLIPVLDRVAYVHSLKEQAVEIQRQKGITSDNVEVNMDGVLYFRVIDPKLASYGVERVGWAISQMAQTTMRAEIGKITLDKTFAERESLNHKITESINKAGEAWGIQCLRYEIKDISTPEAVRMAMDRQAQAERTKRATVLDSEGHRDSEINVAEGQKQSAVLAAAGTAEATIKQAEATAQAINLVADAINKQGGREAVALRIAEQYVRAFGNLAQKSTTMLLPANTADPAAMVAQAMSIYDKVIAKSPTQLAKAATSSTESFKLADAVQREGPRQ